MYLCDVIIICKELIS